MFLNISQLKDLHKKRFFLANPDMSIIGTIKNPTNKSGTFKLTPYSEVSFTVKKFEDENLVYSKITKLQKVLIEDIGWFILGEPSISYDGQVESKSCSLYSAEYELTHRMLKNLYLNTGDAGSIGNVETGFVMFYDAENPELSALDIVLEKFPGWKIGYIHPLLAIKKAIGSFSVESQDAYSFLTNNLANAAECFFIFDILNFTISAYPWSQFGEIYDVYLSNDTIIKTTKCDPVDESDIVTAITVQGADNLSIREVNCGFDYLYNFEYYYDKMPSDLVDAWKAYEIKLNENIESYRSAIVTYTKSQEAANSIKNMMPLDASSEDVKDYGIVPLETLLTNVNQTISNYEEMGFNVEGSEYYDEYLSSVARRDEIIAEKENKQNQYDSLTQTAQENMNALSEIASLVSWENNFTEEQIETLSHYIREGDFTDETFLTTDIFTYDQTIQKKWELKEYATDRLSEMSRPQYSISTTLANLSGIEEYQSICDKISLGHLITVMFNEFVDIPIRLLSFSLSFDEISDISIEYSNMKRSRNGVSDLAYLLQNGTGSISRSISSSGSGGGSGGGYGGGGSGSGSGGDYVTREELKTQLFNLNLTNGGNTTFSPEQVAYLTMLVNGKFNTLEGSYIVTKVLEADEATINKLSASIIQSGYAEIGQLVADSAAIEILNSKYANIETLLSGKAGIGELTAFHITADNVVID